MVANGPERSTPSGDIEELAAALGVEVTAEGQARARRELDEHRAAMTPERWNALRAQLGMPPRPSAA